MAIKSLLSFKNISEDVEQRRNKYNISIVVLNVLICLIGLAILTAMALMVVNLIWSFTNVNTLNKYIVNELCTLPKKTGKCRGIYIRYFYDNNINNCSEFIYGGCGGNTNKFISYDDCMNKCIEKIYI